VIYRQRRPGCNADLVQPTRGVGLDLAAFA